MKKLALIILSLLTMSALSAQELRRAHLPFYDSAKADNLLEINAHAGIGLSTILQNYKDAVPAVTNMQMTPGCNLGLGVDVRFNIRNSFGFATGLDFGICNNSYGLMIAYLDNNSMSSMYVKQHFYNVTVPLYVSFRFNIAPRVVWNADGGIYISYGLGGNMKVNGFASGENAIGQTVITHTDIKLKYFEASQPVINAVKRHDWGPRLATGLTLNHKYFINAVLQVSAPNLAINRGSLDVKYRNLSFAFQLGYIFW